MPPRLPKRNPSTPRQPAKPGPKPVANVPINSADPDALRAKEEYSAPSSQRPDEEVIKATKKSKRNERNDEFQLLERRKKVAQMYCEGKSQFEIAKAFNVSQAMISYDLKTIREAWLATAILDWDDVKSKELAKLDLIEERMWEAYHRTVGQEVVSTKNVKKELRQAIAEQPGRSAKRRGKGVPPPDDPSWNSDVDGPKPLADLMGEERLTIVEETENTRTKDIPGNPAYMTIILECIKTRCKILGFLDDKNGANSGQQVGAIDWDMIALVKTTPDPIEARISKLLVIEGSGTPQGFAEGQETPLNPVGKVTENPHVLSEKREE